MHNKKRRKLRQANGELAFFGIDEWHIFDGKKTNNNIKRGEHFSQITSNKLEAAFSKSQLVASSALTQTALEHNPSLEEERH